MDVISGNNDFFGSGLPKICVPIVGRSQDDILESAQELAGSAADFAEWRVDYYEAAGDGRSVLQTADLLGTILGDVPLLFTFRTAREGGEGELLFSEYRDLLLAAAGCEAVDFIDVELFGGKEQDVRSLVAALRRQAAVIGSYHNFERTPPKDEIVKRLCTMSRMGADIPKIAVMPECEEDVLCLLQATVEAKRQLGMPVITMSMGRLGLISRLHGGMFGSAVTFGCLGKASAPGQIDVSVLRRILEMTQEAEASSEV